jgi:phenylacetic acid degradation operon negative regulatory protein
MCRELPPRGDLPWQDVAIVVRMASDDGAAEVPPEVSRARRPQFLTLMLFGVAAFRRPVAVAAGSVMDVLGDLGVSSHAARSTLTRMVDRGLLARHRLGREVYFALTDHGSSVLGEGRAAGRQSPNRDWDGTWTVVSFSLPEDQRAVRYQMRSRLVWRGFGLLQGGMWIAAGPVDIETLLGDLRVDRYIRVFTAAPAAPTTDADLILDAFDLPVIAARYEGFVSRWDNTQSAPGDPLCFLLTLQSEWAQIARADPRLPLNRLPPEWPAPRAFELYQRMYEEAWPAAQQACAERVRTVELTDEQTAAAARPGRTAV